MPARGGRWYILLVSKTRLGAGAHALLGPLRDGVPTRAHSLKTALSFDSEAVAEIVLAGLKREQEQYNPCTGEYSPLLFGSPGKEHPYALPCDCTAHVVQIAPERLQVPLSVRRVQTPYGLIKLKSGQMCLFGE